MSTYKKFSNGLYKVNSAVSKVELGIAALGMTALVVLMLYQVLARYFLAISAPWVEELCRMVFIDSAFFGSAYCLWNWDNIEIDLIDTVVDKLFGNPAKIKKIMKKAVQLILTVFLLYYLHNYHGYLTQTAKMNQYSAAMHIHMKYPIGLVEVGLALSLFHCFSLLLLPAEKEEEWTK